MDSERQARFQTEQAFIAALLAKSTLELTQQDLKSFSEVVEVNQERVKRGDLAEGEFYKISLQRLQFEQDVSAAEVGVIQAKAALRQLMGFETVADGFEIDGDLAFTRYTLSLDDLKRQALEARPDVLAAKANVQLATGHGGARERPTARVTWTARARLHAHRARTTPMGVAVSFDLPFRRPQPGQHRAQRDCGQSGDPGRGRDPVRRGHRCRETLTPRLKRTRRFSPSISPVTSIRRTSRSRLRPTSTSTAPARFSICWTPSARIARRELAYRQSLAAYMTSVRQINFAVGKQVIP